MKKAVILHGTDGSPDGHWLPWIRKKLEVEGYKAWAPLLPENHTPNRQIYNDFLLGSGWDFKDNIVIGHSSGAVSILNLLMDERCPKVKLAIIVSAWAHGIPLRYEKNNQQFKNLFPHGGFNFNRIRQNAKRIVFLHSDNDPYCPLEQAKLLTKQLDAPLIIVHNGHHLGGKYKQFPKIWGVIESSLEGKI